MTTFYVTCPVCGFPIEAKIPRGGDGSTVRVVWHRNYDKRPTDSCGGISALVDASEAKEEPRPRRRTD